MSSSKKTGFTLIELLVVVVIIGVIASIVIISLGQIRRKARDARRISDVRQTMLALELYYDDHLRYPEKGAVGAVDSIPASSIFPYLEKSPEDSDNVVLACQPEGYRWWGNTGHAQKYCLWACLESGGFFTASPRGVRLLENSPTNLDCQ